MMAITLPAGLEINAFVGESDKGCFQIELCCLFSGSKAYPCLITCYLSIEKCMTLVVVKFAIFAAPLDPNPHLIRKQRTRYPSCRNTAHYELIGHNVLRCTIRNAKLCRNILEFQSLSVICNRHLSACMLIIFGCFSKAIHPLRNSTIPQG